MKITLRKTIISAITISSLFLMVSCGSEQSKEVDPAALKEAEKLYEQANVSADYILDYAEDIITITNRDFSNKSDLTIDYLVKDLNISKDDVLYGISVEIGEYLTELTGQTLTAAEFDYLEETMEDVYFLQKQDPKDLAIEAIQNAYNYRADRQEVTGNITSIQDIVRDGTEYPVDSYLYLDYYTYTLYLIHQSCMDENLSDFIINEIKYGINEATYYQEKLDNTFAETK